MTEAIRVVSTHNFLYSDRHRKLYPNPFVYFEGDRQKVYDFIPRYEAGKTALEINQELKLQYRGDVLFATLLFHFMVRDGLFTRPTFRPEIPPELLEGLARYEADWLASREAAKDDGAAT